MATITVEITDSEFKALEHIAADPVEWFKEWVIHRSFVATNDIVSLVTTHCLDNSGNTWNARSNDYFCL
mgnify:CR=1 FL=1